MLSQTPSSNLETTSIFETDPLPPPNFQSEVSPPQKQAKFQVGPWALTILMGLASYPRRIGSSSFDPSLKRKPQSRRDASMRKSAKDAKDAKDAKEELP